MNPDLESGNLTQQEIEILIQKVKETKKEMEIIKNKKFVKVQEEITKIYKQTDLKNTTFNGEMELKFEKKQAVERFFPIIRKEKVPEGGYFIDTEDILAFKGLGKKSSEYFGMVLVPTFKHGFVNNEIVLASYKDLKTEHLHLLNLMKNDSIKFVKELFCKFKGLNVEENLHFGFHYPPTIGYLHMHVLFGPLTEHGKSLMDRWVDLENVIKSLK